MAGYSFAMTTHVRPTPWCFLPGYSAHNCPPGNLLYSCPDSTIWPNPSIPCHATVAVPVPGTGAADMVAPLAAGSILILCGVLCFVILSLLFRR